MKPILLIHGYSAESKKLTPEAITAIYGDLPADLRQAYGESSIFELDVSRYISLNDGISLDDLATAMQQALTDNFPYLLQQPFNVIIHSTGALVVRNWIRLYSKKPSPINHIIYLAGANFGSGWAHIGRGQLAKWGRLVFKGGSERGLRVLDALELGSSQTLDLHRFFLNTDDDIYQRYKIREFCISGSQVNKTWLPIPIRFAHEDGSDGVVRVASCNINMNYVDILPTQRAFELNWQAVEDYRAQFYDRNISNNDLVEYYRVGYQYLTEEAERPAAPLAIPFECAHNGEKMGIVQGSRVRSEILELLDIAIQVDSEAQYKKAFETYAERTKTNYNRAVEELSTRWFQGLRNEPRQQYDPHAQVIFRLRDQYNQPIEHYDVFFDSPEDAKYSINTIFEHTYGNSKTPGIVIYYMRLAHFDKDKKQWADQLAKVNSVNLEVSPTEPQTTEIQYVPLHITISGQRLRRFIQPHCTTVINIQLLRLPAPSVFAIHNAIT